MKKFFSIMLISTCLTMLTVGCNKNETTEIKDSKQQTEENQQREDEIIKIMENVYVDYINDINMDQTKYIGKTIEIEGMFTKEKDEKHQEHLYIYRNVDVMDESYENEYSHDGEVHNHEDTEIVETKCGLEFSYEGSLPKEDDWIKVTGKIQQKDNSIIIVADSLEVMEERGLEKVTSFY